ncbi:hypothetical protein ZWY2020_044980 [Hordeum vulgare]|nr:hypothetical protein ZWY2020_044980 [Hordeum vulgare]
MADPELLLDPALVSSPGRFTHDDGTRSRSHSHMARRRQPTPLGSRGGAPRAPSPARRDLRLLSACQPPGMDGSGELRCGSDLPCPPRHAGALLRSSRRWSGPASSLFLYARR